MRALQIASVDGPSGMATAEIEPPARGESEVLIDVHAAGVAYPDLLLSMGAYQYQPDLPFVPGSEIAGIVLEAPTGSGLEPGMRVAAYTHLGGYQEIAVAPADQVFAIPDHLSFVAAAALPINYLTAHFALRTRGSITPGDFVLVHGAGGGLGVASVQLARAWGATVIAVVSDEAKAAVAQQAGAHHVIPVEGFLAAVKDLTGGRGVNIVVDPVGGDRVTDSLRSLAPLGRLLVLGFTGGDIPSIKVNRLLLNNLDAIGVGWGAYAMAHDGFMQEQWSEILPLLEAEAFTPLVAIECTLETVPDVLQAMASRTLAGKAVSVLQ